MSLKHTKFYWPIRLKPFLDAHLNLGLVEFRITTLGETTDNFTYTIIGIEIRILKWCTWFKLYEPYRYLKDLCEARKELGLLYRKVDGMKKQKLQLEEELVGLRLGIKEEKERQNDNGSSHN